MTHEQKTQLTGVRIRWMLLAPLKPSERITALKLEGWDHPAIDAVAAEKAEAGND